MTFDHEYDCAARASVQLADLRSAAVGASLLAMVVNDDARILDARGAHETIASKLAPTRSDTGFASRYRSFGVAGS